MSDQMLFEDHLAELFIRYAELAPVVVDRSIGERAIASRRRTRAISLRLPAVQRPVYIWAAIAMLLLAALLAAFAASRLLPRPPQLPGRFTETGPSQIAFIDAAAPLLDGRVLVMGNSKPLNPAGEPGPEMFEFFDPATNSFLPGPTPLEQLQLPTLTALADGRVLLAGGLEQTGSSQTSVAAAEIWDPATGRFERTGSLNASRGWASATLLNDGRVLVAGGEHVEESSSEQLYTG